MHTLRTRSKYDTLIILLYHLKKEHVLADSFRETIPASTISGWRNADISSYKGYQYRDAFEETFNHMELMQKYRHLKTTLTVITKVWNPYPIL
jgi:hypothetical protein